jgi:hypothetical protein
MHFCIDREKKLPLLPRCHDGYLKNDRYHRGGGTAMDISDF